MWLVRQASLVFALAVVLAGGISGAWAASTETSFNVVGGTWISGAEGRLLGPAWEMDAPTSTFLATVNGPDGFSRRIGGAPQRFIGMPSTRAIHWCTPEQCTLAPSVGAWTATGDDKSQVAFSIDPASRLTPVVLDKNTFQSGTGEVTGTWTAGDDAKSFIVYVQPASSTSATVWTAGAILPAGARTVTFSGLGLDPATTYSLDIFGFAGDITGGPLPSVFNVASDRLDFTAGQPVVPSPPTPSPPRNSPLKIVPAPPEGAVPAVVFSPNQGVLRGLSASWRRAVPFASRGFSINLLLKNTSSRSLTVAGVTAPVPAGSLLRQGKTTLTVLGCPARTSCKSTLKPGQRISVQLSYAFVGCDAARKASTKTGEWLVISYRYGGQAVRQQTLPIGAARVVPLKPTATDCG